jgi:hypothetical protein
MVSVSLSASKMESSAISCSRKRLYKWDGACIEHLRCLCWLTYRLREGRWRQMFSWRSRRVAHVAHQARTRTLHRVRRVLGDLHKLKFDSTIKGTPLFGSWRSEASQGNHGYISSSLIWYTASELTCLKLANKSHQEYFLSHIACPLQRVRCSRTRKWRLSLPTLYLWISSVFQPNFRIKWKLRGWCQLGTFLSGTCHLRFSGGRWRSLASSRITWLFRWQST